MKRLIAITALILTGLGSFGQGTVNLDNNIPGVLVTQVYWTLEGGRRQGNAPSHTPPGTQYYGDSYPLEGPGFCAQIWAATNGGIWLPAFPITTFRTGFGAGFVLPVIATLTGVPSDAAVAMLQLRAWDSSHGTILDWESAIELGLPTGVSPSFEVRDIGGQVNPPPNLIGLQSFTIWALPLPPPSPRIVSTDPPNEATGVSRTASMVFTFSEPMKTYTRAVLRDVTVIPPIPPPLPVSSQWSDGNTVLTCTPVQPFLANRIIAWHIENGLSASGKPLPNPPPPQGDFRTGNAPVCVAPTVSGDGFTFDVLSSPGQSLTVQYTTSLLPGSWQTLLTTNSPGNTVRIIDPRPRTSPGVFYRVTTP